jgi:type IV secretion system protein VirB5
MSSNNEHQDERYLVARREWLERYGDYIAQAKNWRLAAFASLGMAVLFAAGTVYEADRVHTKIEVVAVNKFGKSLMLGQAVSAGAFQRPVVEHVLTHWLTLVRERIPAVPAEAAEIKTAYNYISASEEGQLNAYFKRHGPYKDYSKHLGGRTVTITSTLPVGKTTAAGGTFQIDWTEKQYGGRGSIANETHWQADITYAVTKPSSNPNVLEGNPFGIYITAFSWNPTL